MYTFCDVTIECIHSTTFYILYNIYNIAHWINTRIKTLNMYIYIYHSFAYKLSRDNFLPPDWQHSLDNYVESLMMYSYCGQ